jgi:hypothetical protein
MLHVLTHGRSQHVAWLRSRFGDDGIESWIRARRGRGLTRAEMSRWIPAATISKWQAADPNALLWENR